MRCHSKHGGRVIAALAGATFLAAAAHAQTPFVSASLQNGNYGGGLTQDTMAPYNGGSPHNLGIVDSAAGVTFTSTESNGRGNAVIWWDPGASRNAFRQHGTISFWMNADHDAFTAMATWGHLLCENYGWTAFHHGQSTFSISASTAYNGAGAADDRLRLGWSTWHNNVWYYPSSAATVDLEFNRWYNVGYVWGGPDHDYEIWVDGQLALAYDLPSGVVLPWGLSTSGAVLALGGAHERGMSDGSYSSAPGVTFRDLAMYDAAMPLAATVPEPASLGLLGAGALLLWRRTSSRHTTRAAGR